MHKLVRSVRRKQRLFLLGLAGLSALLLWQPPRKTTDTAAIEPGRDMPLAAMQIAHSSREDQSVSMEPVQDIQEPSTTMDSSRSVEVNLPKAAKAKEASNPSPKHYKVIRMLVTAYCPCRECCGPGAKGITASGWDVHANHSRFVAADTRLLPFETKVSVPGYYGGMPVAVLDRGADIKGRRLDVYFPSHKAAKEWGSRWLDVTVYQD